MKKIFSNFVFPFACVLSLASCGVRGGPQAPKEPPWIGSGRPQFFEKKETKANPPSEVSETPNPKKKNL